MFTDARVASNLASQASPLIVVLVLDVEVDVVGKVVDVVGSIVVLVVVLVVLLVVVLVDVLVDVVEVVVAPANVRWCSACRDPGSVANSMQAVTLQSTVPSTWFKTNVVETATVVVKLPELSVVKVARRGCLQKPRAHWNIWPSTLGSKPIPTTVTV